MIPVGFIFSVSQMGNDVRTFRLHSRACDNNQAPIMARLEEIFAAPGLVLEVGSGSGQHAAYFAERLPHVIWQPTDTAQFLDELTANIEDFAPANVRQPLELDVSMGWPDIEPDYGFTANTLHIVSEAQVRDLIAGTGARIRPGGCFVVYGPFRYKGDFTTPSNARFDEWLKSGNPASGIRDFEWIDELMTDAGLRLRADHDMPANNQLLVYEAVR